MKNKLSHCLAGEWIFNGKVRWSWFYMLDHCKESSQITTKHELKDKKHWKPKTNALKNKGRYGNQF